ncbi:MAG: hypothetical protein IPO08_20665 [Xanthomonadales bacterium]|nr:hypothetical protein [Xanthomonadales bacterium]
MSLTTILTQFALTVGASLAERVASALSARIKQEPKPEAKPVDIAIATKSAVSADREGKIASAVGKCAHGNVATWQSVIDGWHHVRCNDCDTGISRKTRADAWAELFKAKPIAVRRLGDYGPGGE